MTISGNEARQNRTTPGAEPNASPLSISPLALPFKKGEVLAQKYRVESLIGTGGIGFVIAATHVELGERLALKFLRPEFVTHAEAVRRFASEARHAARIRSEHVARVYDVGSLPDGAPFIVMEYLEGTDLHQLLHREGPLSIERAVGFVVEACEALAAAHACYIIHRDIKPDNLFLAKQPHGTELVKVLDFGISKAELDATLHEDGVASANQTVGALGSPSYMAPEQIRSAADVDGRADIWSLGCVLYELLTMRHAFDAPSLMQVCAAVLETEPVPLADHRADVPEELEAVVMRCLEKDPARRYPDLGVLVRALSPFAPPRAQASIEKTLETVRNTRPYSADDAPPSSRVVRSRPSNERPAVDESAVRPLPQDVDAEWEAIASDRDPPSLRAPSIIVDDPSDTGRLASLAPPKASSAERASALSIFTVDSSTATPAEARLLVPGKLEALTAETVGAPETTSVNPSLDELARVAQDDDEDEPTRVFSKSLLTASTTQTPESIDEAAATPAVEPRRPRAPRPIETTPSIIIQDFPRPPTPIEHVPDANWAMRSLVPLWIGIALAVLGIVAVEWRVWWPPSEEPAKREPPPLRAPTSRVVEIAPAPAPAAKVAETPRNDDAPEARNDDRPPPKVPRAPRPHVVANSAWRARGRSPNVPKIQAIAQEVDLASDEEPSDLAESEATPTAPSPAPEPKEERKPLPFGAIVPPVNAEPNRAPESSAGSSPSVTSRNSAALAPSQVARVVREHASEIQACYDRAAMEHPDLHGRITLRAVVDEHGSVSSASTSSIEDGARLSGCIAERAKRWRFPESPSGKSPISYTFVFE